MNKRTHIHNELQSIAPGLLNISVAMPYSLPPAYFSGLAAAVFLAIKKEREAKDLLANLDKAMPYSIPYGYFEQLADAVLQRLHTELLSEQEPALFGEISKTTPYAVPSGYFEQFSISVLQKIKEEEQQQTIPTSYFDSLPDMLLAKVRKLDTSKELDEVAPLLNTISKQPVQHVPAGYFESLQPNSKATPSVSDTPVVSIQKQNNWLKYAVAASIVLLLSFGSYLLFNNSHTTVPSIANQPTESVINDQLAKLDTNAIEDYLKTNNAIVQTAMPDGGLEELSNGDLDELLQGFSDQQLKEHLEETPELPAASSSKTHT